MGADVSRAVRRERLGHVRTLLANVEETGHPAADVHVARAKGLVGDLLDGSEGADR